MAQLVSDFIITPVLRQARRFSSGFATNEPPAVEAPAWQHARSRSAEAGIAILEGDESGRPPPEVAGGDTGHSGAAVPDSSSLDAAASPARPSPLRLPPTASDTPAAEEPDPHATTEPNGQLNTAAASTAAEAVAEAAAAAAWPPLESNRGTPLPEDDGMGDLRRRIQAIQLLAVTQDTKAQMMHGVLTERYTRLQQSPRTGQATLRPVSPTSGSTPDVPEPVEHIGPLQVLKKWNPLGEGSGPLNLPLTEEDLKPTFAPNNRPADRADWWSVGGQADEEEEKKRLGCEHYRRNVKLQCASCERWHTCRHCHDAVEDHVLPRQQTKHMLCMLCGCAQKASDTCTKCGQSAAYYYCGICKLWNDDPNKPIYHCPDCGLCRVGQGLGKDFFHCKKCMACISMSDTNNHKCIERAVDSDCPICNEYLFNSPKSVIFMQCGHSIHLLCFEELKKTSYRCPLCNKSCVNMEYHFRQLDMQILQQPMPPDYADARAVISCNDCCAKSQTAFHWLGLKCAVCRSYNTTQLQLLNMPGGGGATDEERQQERQQQQQQAQDQAQRQQQPVFLDPAFLAEELRQRNRAARREQSRQRDQEQQQQQQQPYNTLAMLSTSPSSFSPAFLLRLLNRTPSTSAADCSPDQQQQHPRPTSSSSSLLSAVPVKDTPPSAVGAAACDSDSDDDEDMLDLFGGANRDREFDRMTGLTSSAESGVGFDDDEEEEESSEEEENEEEEEEEDEDEEDDILLLGHR